MTVKCVSPKVTKNSDLRGGVPPGGDERGDRLLQTQCGAESLAGASRSSPVPGGNLAARDRPAAWGTSSVAALGTSMAGAPTQLMSARRAAARSGAEMAPNAERNRREKQTGSPEEDRVSQQREWSHEVALRA